MDGQTDFARLWTAQVYGTSFVSLTRPETERFLLGLTGRLAAALTAEPFSALPAAEVAEDLVAAHYTGPTVLDRTLRLVGDHLLSSVDLSGNGASPNGDLTGRVHALMASLAAGYADALRERTFDEQETIKRAVLRARDDAEAALRTSDARFRTMFAVSPVGLAVTDLAGRLTEFNAALLGILRIGHAELAGRTLAEFVHPEDAAALARAEAELEAGLVEGYQTEKRFLLGDDDLVWAYLSVALIHDSTGAPAYRMAMVEDISQRHLLFEQLRRQTLHDPLTALPNRTRFTAAVDGLLAQAGPHARVALCLFDLDGFRVVNGGLGPGVGDEVLKEVAGRIRAEVADEPEAMPAYLGGDRFAVLLPRSAGGQNAVAVTERVLAAVGRPIQVVGHRLTVSASAGIVERPAAGVRTEDLLRDADVTLHWAKTDGRAQWTLFDADRARRERARYEMATTMALAMENEEFYLEYQPVVRLSDGSVRAVEALLRWDHPELGLLVQDDFCVLAEEIGLIVRLGSWVLREACTQAARWAERLGERAPGVSVNLCPRQLRDADLVRDVRAVLAETGLAPERLWLEVSENAVSPNAAEAIETVDILAEMGVAVVLDDFGRDPADPAHLRTLPLRAVKVTRLPSAETAPDPAREQAVGDLINLAHVLELPVIVDHVHTREQAEVLATLGCDAGQGPYYGKADTDAHSLLSGRSGAESK
ncbi:diguanylate cyclase (GGDEF)-like protein/PAS domain S-box-containing protein [Crossiella equi]|uniref:Diguanylate cyclase (GGDEF)-like protein/PAS domain S-box-containing protein n=1 Tax=Crossiella equi TaxID=130796 RepID=A0ABS5ACH3_9PSEU|nr:bifunctional diguanylate cyclase/phosphodiesterase [Crossiella equi]MBP2474281.1 diguanylate cyclase (GGDEF)-like protein/PAS domain S-box-containing protein [Crossiella equi]